MRCHQSGLSLVELLIGIALGLLLTAAALSSLLVSREAYRTTDTLSRVQENARFAIQELARAVRIAGYRDPANGLAPEPFFADACGAFDPCTADGGGNDSDRIAVMLDPPPDDGTDTDCVGNGVEADAVIANVYYIQVSGGISSLMCRGYDVVAGNWAGSAQPLVDGIDTMQVLYGLMDNGGLTEYVSADRVDNWLRVGAVRIGLLVSTGQEVGGSDLAMREYTLLDADPINREDRFQRHVFFTTIAINNPQGEMP